ncbi:aldo/keto reductase [Clostridium estertheticum]|uniref:Aldo/keto reductase n=1 Tax=Clostridium estertheticum subsp. estertheticum TaxID=1552 RepID=A0A1J0GCH9_9CLOT|nr:aldo/keto reductase [Clostridium estertheticum]APC39057.1 aldo/keto reductase [Clostridium estertheticum subsp. estertheticum]MBU3074954.1 aldo/keto reductase [Clostridium estertheticum]MBU3165169.1 aldo/keto reductase [Clostridium estertheticum]MBU3173786.1 aldo/keto reductase [Clostridium estertheticum]MBZ9614982.1 aldo/keto reductase [Clostridium estertheticum subsp. laramiense]
MDKIKLGRTNLMVTRSGFGALPVQRVSFDEAKNILRKAYDNGINFFDTARAYSDSEEKIGYSLSDVRENIIIATKTHAKDRKTLLEHLQTSLINLKTDYIDIYQLHNPDVLPDPKDPEGLYAGLLEAKKKGLIRFIGITNHKLKNAMEAAASGLYDTIQFPLCSLSSDDDLLLIKECKKRNIGLIAMKALSGGLITDASSAFAFLRQFDNVVPIWGIQRETELDEFITLEKNPPLLDDIMWSIINKDRSELSGDFCRGCGYCLPCPAGIEIPTSARISLLLKRAPYQGFLDDSFKEKMELINNCINCGHCKNHCPYKLDTPNLLKRELKSYSEFYAKNKNI